MTLHLPTACIQSTSSDRPPPAEPLPAGLELVAVAALPPPLRRRAPDSAAAVAPGLLPRLVSSEYHSISARQPLRPAVSGSAESVSIRPRNAVPRRDRAASAPHMWGRMLPLAADSEQRTAAVPHGSRRSVGCYSERSHPNSATPAGLWGAINQGECQGQSLLTMRLDAPALAPSSRSCRPCCYLLTGVHSLVSSE